jgi:hypothetical protein
MHDDFSNLLLAETLCLGRVCNPTPIAAESLETFHVLVTPTYTSKFPIGPALFLSLGKMVVGSPAFGLWCCAALATACLSWMLASIFTARWVMWIGLLLAIHPCWQNGWAQEYTHGWLPMSGCALVLGSVLRLRNRVVQQEQCRVSAFTIALGIGLGGCLVLFSRPFDGGIVCFLLVVSLLPRILTQRWYEYRVFWSSAGIASGLLLAGLLVQVGINRQITGHWTQLPYQLHEQQYGVAPLFVWSKPHEPTLGHRFREIESFHREGSLGSWARARSASGFVQLFWVRIQNLAAQWGYLLTCLPLLSLAMQSERSRFGWLWCIALLSLLIINTIPWVMPAYVASLVPIALLLACVGVRGWIRVWIQQCSDGLSASLGTDARPARVSSRRRVEWIVITLFGFAQLSSFAIATWSRATHQKGWERDWAEHRVDVERQLDETPGRHLVLVAYSPQHNVHEEWVYNAPEPELAKVVWARCGDERLNESLLRGYADRRIWLMDADQRTLRELGFASNLTHRSEVLVRIATEPTDAAP